MLQQFCDEKLKKVIIATVSNNNNNNNGSTPASAVSSGKSSHVNGSNTTTDVDATNEENVFDVVCADMKSKRMLFTIENIKTSIASYHHMRDSIQAYNSNNNSNSSGLNDSFDSVALGNSSTDVDAASKLKGVNLHSMTIHLTGGTLTNANFSILVQQSNNNSSSNNNNNNDRASLIAMTMNNRKGSYENADINTSGGGRTPTSGGMNSNSNSNALLSKDVMIEQATVSVCMDTYNSVYFMKIMQTIYIRLICCRAAGKCMYVHVCIRVSILCMYV